MHELSMHERNWCQKMKVSAALKDLKLSRFSDIWTINKIHKFLVHELKMRLKISCANILHFNAKKDSPLLWKLI
jgi:hypothetical protein